MVESLAAGRRLCSQADTTWCIPAESYYCSGENAVIVGRCCVYQLSNQQPKEISEEIRPVSEGESLETLNVFNTLTFEKKFLEKENLF